MNAMLNEYQRCHDVCSQGESCTYDHICQQSQSQDSLPPLLEDIFLPCEAHSGGPARPAIGPAVQTKACSNYYEDNAKYQIYKTDRYRYNTLLSKYIIYYRLVDMNLIAKNITGPRTTLQIIHVFLLH